MLRRRSSFVDEYRGFAVRLARCVNNGSHVVMFSQKTVFAAGTVLALVAGTGCVPTMTQVTRSAAEALRPPIFKMVVFGSNMDAEFQRAIEDALVVDLRARGVDARAAHAIFATSPTGNEAALATTVAQGYEAVLRVTFAEVQRGEPFANDDKPSSVWSFQSSLWDPAENRLVWSADTRTANPVGPKDLGTSISSAILPELTQAHLILPVRAQGG